MALPSSRDDHRKAIAIAMTVPQLLTPEEPLAHSFAGASSNNQGSASFRPIHQTASPPASPEFRSCSTEPSFSHRDDVLYPDHSHVEPPAPEPPLFDHRNRWTTPERQQSPATESSLSVSTPPSQHDSPLQPATQLATSSSSSSRTPHVTSSPKTQADLVGPVALLNTYGLDYYRYCLSQSEEHRAKRMERQLPTVNPTRATGRDRYTQQMLSSLGRSHRVEKPRSVIGPSHQRLRVTRTAAPVQRVVAAGPVDASPIMMPATKRRESPASTKRSRRQPSTSDASFGAASPAALQPKPRTRAAPSKKIEEKDTLWLDIPDRCPPLSSLDALNKKLTVQWHNSNALDLSNDPDRHHLHPQEFEVAQVLRLRCGVYLANKRRIFTAKVNALKEGKEFNKTSAQTSTSIDVNKASRLWAAFDGVGWFDEKWFTQWV